MNDEKKKKIQMIKLINLNYFKAQFGSINHFTTYCLIFLFTPECRFPGKRRDLLVDRIVSGIYLEKQRKKRK